MTARLSEGQWRALANLRQKQTGATVGWINIADARVLADLGLARRTGAGWVLTAEGEALLTAERATQESLSPDADILNFANDEGAKGQDRLVAEEAAPAEGLEPPTS